MQNIAEQNQLGSSSPLEKKPPRWLLFFARLLGVLGSFVVTNLALTFLAIFFFAEYTDSDPATEQLVGVIIFSLSIVICLVNFKKKGIVRGLFAFSIWFYVICIVGGLILSGIQGIAGTILLVLAILLALTLSILDYREGKVIINDCPPQG